MKRRIGIVGSGTTGLQLAYSLKEVFDVTIFHYRTAEEIRQGRVLSTQVHFAPALERESRFRMPQWESAPSIRTIHVGIGDRKLFVGQLNRPASSVDQRLAFSHAMKDLARQGVPFRRERVTPDNVETLAEEFELLIDATGNSGPLVPFPKEEALSPFETPQRKCIVGYFAGVAPVHPTGISITVLPGVGEMFEIPALTERGPVTILFIEAVPGGALDAFIGIKNPDAFTGRMLEIARHFFPDIHGRIDPETFTLTDEKAFLQIALTPAIYRPYLMVKGTPVLGCGDSVFLNDPITGQGCNTTSHCADDLYRTLTDHRDSPWDEQLGEEYWNRTRPYVRAVTEWSNAMTGPLPEHVVQMLMKGAQDQETADRVAAWFDDPRLAHDAFFPAAAR